MKRPLISFEELERIAKTELGGSIKPHAIGLVLSSIDPVNIGQKSKRVLTVKEICEAVRDVAAREYGLMAREVLNEWGVDSTEAIGRIVFALVAAKKLNKTDEDSLSDFNSVFNFDDAFSPAAILKASRDTRSRVRRRPN